LYQFGKEKALLQQDATDAKRKCEELEKLLEKEKTKAKVVAATPDPQLEKLQVRTRDQPYFLSEN